MNNNNKNSKKKLHQECDNCQNDLTSSHTHIRINEAIENDAGENVFMQQVFVYYWPNLRTLL